MVKFPCDHPIWEQCIQVGMEILKIRASMLLYLRNNIKMDIVTMKHLKEVIYGLLKHITAVNHE